MRKTLMLLLIAAAAGACVNFTGPTSRDCAWRYTKFQARADTTFIFDSRTGEVVATMVTVRTVPTDSLYDCRTSDRYGG